MDLINNYFETGVINDVNNYDFKTKRYLKFEKYLKRGEFDKLMLRLVHEHNEEYINNCYGKGYYPKPNNKLQFIFDYIEDNFVKINIRQLKINSAWSFNGYFFQYNCINGGINVYNKDDLKLMISL